MNTVQWQRSDEEHPLKPNCFLVEIQQTADEMHITQPLELRESLLKNSGAWAKNYGNFKREDGTFDC